MDNNELRLECLKLAISKDGYQDTDQVVERAKAFLGFVTERINGPEYSFTVAGATDWNKVGN